MAAKRGRSAQRLELGLQLRQLRENCGLGDRGGGFTRKQAIQGTRLSESALQRVETGVLNFRNVTDLRKLLSKYGVDDDEFIEYLIDLNRESAKRDWLTKYLGLAPPGMAAFVGLEQEAVEIKAYHPTLVFGLLQTERYMRALHMRQKPIEERTSEQIENSIALRLKRQEVLTRENPVKLRAILWEAALRYQVGGPEVMREQFARLAEVASWEHVTLQVLPFGPSYRCTYDFQILSFDDQFPSQVQVDNAWGLLSTSDKPRETARFGRRFDAMVAAAQPPEGTPKILHNLEREL